MFCLKYAIFWHTIKHNLTFYINAYHQFFYKSDTRQKSFMRFRKIIFHIKVLFIWKNVFKLPMVDARCNLNMEIFQITETLI